MGTAGNKCNPTTGSCTCKDLVMGAKCDQCTIGYYGFSSDFPNTCLKCYCSGKTSECDAVGDYYLTTASTLFSTTQNNVGLEGWASVDIDGRESGKLEWDWAPLYSVNRFVYFSMHFGSKSFQRKITCQILYRSYKLNIN